MTNSLKERNSESDEKVLERAADLVRRYPRAIYHMRAQLGAKRLLPIFGAGASRSIGFPTWDGLVEQIGLAVGASSGDSERTSQASRVQLIYDRFRRDFFARNEAQVAQSAALRDRQVATEWRKVVHSCLYKNAMAAEAHPYLGAFKDVIRRAPLTINYNFDDTIQELLRSDSNSANNSRYGVGYETVWEPSLQYRSESGVIYHPNGFLPRQLSRGPSAKLVFMEDAFADQLIDAQRGHYSTLLSHLCRFTGLLIGLSLEDPTLKHLLRQCAQQVPGHVHYYVAYVGDSKPSDSRQESIRESNFRTYNLVTVFLSEVDIRTLGYLLSARDEDFGAVVEEAGTPSRFVYYLSGAVGAGKTTSLAALKSLKAYDEWPQERPQQSAHAVTDLTKQEVKDIDDWIDKQMRNRNALIASEKWNIVVIDRSPIDPLAFASAKTRPKRAKTLLQIYAKSSAEKTVNGAVLFLRGNPEVMHSRTVDRHKSASIEYVSELQQKFSRMWSACGDLELVDTLDVSSADMIQRVARIIHLSEYKLVDIEAVANKFASASESGECHA